MEEERLKKIMNLLPEIIGKRSFWRRVLDESNEKNVLYLTGVMDKLFEGYSTSDVLASLFIIMVKALDLSIEIKPAEVGA